MKRKLDKFILPYLIILGTALIVLIVYVGFGTDLQQFILEDQLNNAVDFTDGWEDDSGEPVDIISLNAYQYGDSISLHKNLPDPIPERAALCMVSINANMEVLVGSKEVYRFESKENLTGVGCGITYHSVGLSEADAGKPVTIVLSSVFSDHTGGRFTRLLLSEPIAFEQIIVRETIAPALFSILVMFFGILMLIIHFLIPRKHAIPYHLASLGNGLILVGLWCLIDSDLPQLLTGCVYACRVLDYTLLHLAVFPLTLFIISLTQKKRSVYVQLAFWWPTLCLSSMVFIRYVFGIDMHELSAIMYSSYGGTLLLMLIILIDNGHYCRKNKILSNLSLFYIGAGCFMFAAVLDIILNLFFGGREMSGGYGHCLRYGLIAFLLAMVWQVLRWWTDDRTLIERDRLINKVLQHAMSAQNADTKINAVLENMCTQLHADRAYIFEDQLDGTFANTYEWCAPGIHPEIANLQEVPYDGVIEVWYGEYKKSHLIVIEDLEKYRPVSEKMYQLLKSQGIRSIVTGPLVIDGKYVGFYGVDNPPVSIIEDVSEVTKLLSYVLAQIVSQRDEQNMLLRNSYSDEMTGVRNRRALDEFEANERDHEKPFGYIMCDINGLKATNDTFGHDMGDSLIIDVADALTIVFGAQNVYRMGGDEFVVYDYADNESVFYNEVEQLRKYVERKNRSVSIGAVYCKNGAADLSPVKQQAEAQMYAEKNEYYNGHNDRRSGR